MGHSRVLDDLMTRDRASRTEEARVVASGAEFNRRNFAPAEYMVSRTRWTCEPHCKPTSANHHIDHVAALPE
jgi:hypothetical protein